MTVKGVSELIASNEERDPITPTIPYKQWEASPELRHKLLEAEQQLAFGAKPVPVKKAAAKWRKDLKTMRSSRKLTD